MAQTLQEIAADQKRKKRLMRRFYRRLLPEWLDRRVLFAAVAVLALIIFDGVRRENAEFTATVTQASGTVVWQEQQATTSQVAAVGTKCMDGNLVSTGPNSWATLEFPDGSVITLAPETAFQVRLLEYSRGGRWRARAFRVASGQIWAKVSKYFGAGSDMRVYTPAAVAAVRGTQFSVRHDPAANTTTLACNDGYVSCTGWQGRPTTVAPGQVANCDYGQPVTTLASAPADEFVGFGIAALRSPDREDSWIKKAELTVTYVLDIPLSILGIGRCSWGVGAADYARRAAAMEALRLIHIHLETFQSYPDYVDPVTLKELRVPWEYTQRIQRSLYGAAIERYYKSGNTFLLYARARDKRRSLYKLTPYGVQRGTKEDEAWASL